MKEGKITFKANKAFKLDWIPDVLKDENLKGSVEFNKAHLIKDEYGSHYELEFLYESNSDIGFFFLSHRLSNNLNAHLSASTDIHQGVFLNAISPSGYQNLILNTILFTKDGRKIGNCIITKLPEEEEGRYTLKTDYGNEAKMNRNEILDHFHIRISDLENLDYRAMGRSHKYRVDI